MVNNNYRDFIFIIFFIPISLIINMDNGYEYFLFGFLLFINAYLFTDASSSLISKLLFLCFSTSIYILCGLYFKENLDVLIGPDEYRFYQEYVDYSYDRIGYLIDSISHVVDNNFFHSSSYPVFGFFINPLIDFIRFDTSSHKYIIPINFFLLFLILILLKNIFSISKYNNTYILLFSLSPAVIYHSLIYAKDILSLFLIFLSCLACTRKKVFLFFILLVLASLLRPYAIAIVFVYLSFFFLSARNISVCVLVCLLVTYFFVGISGVVNAFITVPYLVISPNPTNILEGRVDYFPLYFESIIFSLLYMSSIFACIHRRKLDLLIIFHLCLLVYSVVMVLVGYTGSLSYGNSYSFGDMGGNLVRKKIPMIPLIILFFYFSFTSIYKEWRCFRYHQSFKLYF
ncbi:TPA: hypothetical protein P0E34_005041 [Vibrio campbellii]|nr:hypothetical protein [Vibrio campbellii]